MKRKLICFCFAFWSGNSLIQAQVSPQVYTTTGSFTVPSGVSSLLIEAIGAGGRGQSNGGGGGGGGAYVLGNYTVTPGQTLNIIVGDGGSELGSIVAPLGIIANAGLNGTTVGNPNIGGGGAGGNALGGTLINHNGGAGGGGYWTYFGGGGGGAGGPLSDGLTGGNTVVYNGSNCLTPGGSGGAGGGAPAGDGGKGAGFTDNNCTVSDFAGNGQLFGAGGGGGNGIGSPVGTGTGGMVSISWVVTGDKHLNQLIDIPVVFNPFRNNITILNTRGDEQYHLFSVDGRLLFRGPDINGYDFSHLPVAVYYLKMFSNERNYTFRLVKQ